MTLLNDDRKELEHYIRELADLMGLRDWTLTMRDDPASEDCAADIQVTYGRKFAAIRFDPAWASESPETLRATCIHELLHCHLKPTEWALNNAQSALGMVAFSVLSGAYEDALEVAIDGIANEWAKTLPLPLREEQQKAA